MREHRKKKIKEELIRDGHEFTAEEDWIAAVMPAPNTKLFNGLEVIFFKIRSNRPPAIFSKPEDIIVIPYRKNASPPHSVNNENISIN